MKGKLIKLNVGVGYRLDDEHGNLFASTLQSSKTKLSIQNCDEIFGIIDVEKTGECVWDNLGIFNEMDKNLWFGGFRNGFDKALDLNKDKKFTYAQMLYIAGYAVGLSGRSKTDPSLDIKQEIIDAVDKMQPNELEVEVVMDKIPADLAPDGWDVFPKLDAEGCLILKRVI